MKCVFKSKVNGSNNHFGQCKINCYTGEDNGHNSKFLFDTLRQVLLKEQQRLDVTQKCYKPKDTGMNCSNVHLTGDAGMWRLLLVMNASDKCKIVKF